MSAEAAARGHGALEIDAAAGVECAQRTAIERLGHDVDGERIVGLFHDGETDAVDGDRIPVGRIGGDQRAAYGDPRGVVQVFPGHDGAEFFDDAGEHVALLHPLNSEQTRRHE